MALGGDTEVIVVWRMRVVWGWVVVAAYSQGSALPLNRPKHTISCDSPNLEEGGKESEEEEYEPQWQEDYDEDDDLDEDNFLFGNESDNLDCDSYFDDDDAYD